MIFDNFLPLCQLSWITTGLRSREFAIYSTSLFPQNTGKNKKQNALVFLFLREEIQGAMRAATYTQLYKNRLQFL